MNLNIFEPCYVTSPFSGKRPLTDSEKRFLDLMREQGANDFDIWRVKIRFLCDGQSFKFKVPGGLTRTLLRWPSKTGDMYIFNTIYGESDVEYLIGIFKDCYGVEARTGYPAPPEYPCFCCDKFDLDEFHTWYREPAPPPVEKPWWKRIFG